MGLWATDVTTDWINGANLIEEGHLVWGWLMVLTPFLPVAVVCWTRILQNIHEKWPGCAGFFCCLLSFAPFVAVATLIGTPIYLILTFLTHCIRLVIPEGVHPVHDDDDDDDDDEDSVHCCSCDALFREVGPMLIMAEIVGEACPQSMLGNDFFISCSWRFNVCN